MQNEPLNLNLAKQIAANYLMLRWMIERLYVAGGLGECGYNRILDDIEEAIEMANRPDES